MSSNTVIVYGRSELGDPVFILEDFALAWVRINDALDAARTWGDIRRTLPDMCASALEAWKQHRESYEEDYEEPYPYPPSDAAPFDLRDVPPEDGAYWIE